MVLGSVSDRLLNQVRYGAGRCIMDRINSSPLDKMTFLADDIFKCIFFNANDRILIQISLKFVLGSPVDNNTALVQVMALRWIGDKPLPGPMMTQFIDTYMRQYGEMSLNRWFEWVSRQFLHKLHSWYLAELGQNDCRCVKFCCQIPSNCIVTEFIHLFLIWNRLDLSWTKLFPNTKSQDIPVLPMKASTDEYC